MRAEIARGKEIVNKRRQEQRGRVREEGEKGLREKRLVGKGESRGGIG